MIVTLKAWLMNQNKTMSAFAMEIGVPTSTISRLCRGERYPARKILRLIYIKTGGGVTPNDLFHIEEWPVAS